MSACVGRVVLHGMWRACDQLVPGESSWLDLPGWGGGVSCFILCLIWLDRPLGELVRVSWWSLFKSYVYVPEAQESVAHLVTCALMLEYQTKAMLFWLDRLGVAVVLLGSYVSMFFTVSLLTCTVDQSHVEDENNPFFVNHLFVNACSTGELMVPFEFIWRVSEMRSVKTTQRLSPHHSSGVTPTHRELFWGGGYAVSFLNILCLFFPHILSERAFLLVLVSALTVMWHPGEGEKTRGSPLGGRIRRLDDL